MGLLQRRPPLDGDACIDTNVEMIDSNFTASEGDQRRHDYRLLMNIYQKRKTKVVAALCGNGFTEIQPSSPGPHGVQNRSFQAARIFVNRAGDQVVKIAEDPAYAAFVEWATEHRSVTVPVFLRHVECGQRDAKDGSYWTYTRMERLEELTQEEASAVQSWFDSFVATKGLSTLDPFGLLQTLLTLQQVAIVAGRGLELTKTSGLMVRPAGSSRQFVFTDPFN